MVSSKLIMIFLNCISVLCLAMNIASGLDLPPSIHTGSLNIKFSPVTGQPENGGGIIVEEGESLKKLEFGNAEKFSNNNGAISFLLHEKDGSLSVALLFEEKADHVAINISLKNNGKNVRLIQAGYLIPVEGLDLQWWDGRFYSDPGINQMIYEKTHLRLPLSALHNSRDGYAIGLNPECLLSIFANGADKKNNNAFELSFKTRLVLAPDSEIPLPLCAFSFKPLFGYLDAVQRYYDIYPKMFSMNSAISQKILGSGGYLFSGEESRLLQYEESRRYGMGWEWAYCPAQRPGDWYPDERFWDDKIGYGGKNDAHQNIVKGSLEDFRKDMRNRFQIGRPVTASAYYLLPMAADAEYMRSFKDGIIIDEKGVFKVAPKGWCKAPFDMYYTYPWGNSYGEEVVKEFNLIVKDFHIRAFAFDEANRMDTHYGKGIENDSACAWNSNDKYCSVQVAMARLAEEIHKIRFEGLGIAMVMNKPWTYNTSTRTDIAIHEWNSFILEDCFIGLRMLMGHKLISWWKEDESAGVLRWEDLSPEDIRRGITGITAFTRLKCLRYGVTPYNLTMPGHKEYFRIVEQLTEMMKAGGWQPTPAADSTEKLWLSRYGQGIKSFIVAGNPSAAEKDVNLKIFNSYLGGGYVLFALYDGTNLENICRDGNTEVSLGRVKPFGDITARAIAKLDIPVNCNVKASSSFMMSSASDRVIIEWDILNINQKDIEGGIEIGVPSGSSDFILKINDERKAIKELDAKIIYHGKLPARGKLELEYLPEVVIACDEEKLLAFPFTKNGTPSSIVKLEAGSNELDKVSALRIVSFFDWFFRRQQAPDSKCDQLARNGIKGLAIPIVEGEFSSDEQHATIGILNEPGKSQINISKDGKTLTITGNTAELRERAVLKLLKILEKKYPFYGVLPKKPMYIKAGLAGECIE